ncbi:MAG TPA: MBL fold metallo-hydrolase [Brevundimonas sp.]|nr:MBL fold metallo-hydrolase [Brevundimonas sp.]
MREASSLELDMTGRLMWLDQGRTPADAMTFAYRQRLFSDWRASRAVGLFDFQGPDSAFQRNVAADPANANALAGFAVLSPHAVVRELLSRRQDLRLERREAGGGGVISGPVHGRNVEVVIDADGLIREVRSPYNDPMVGDAVRSYRFADYADRDGWRAPGRVEQWDAGRLTMEMSFTRFAPGAERPEWAAALAPPAAAATAPSAPPAPAAAPRGLEARPLAPGVHLLHGHGGADYHGLLVEMPDGFMVLETPGAIRDGSELRRVVAGVSAKPILYAAATHHHGDHASGMAGVAREGVTVLTTPGNVELFTVMVGAQRAIAGMEQNGAPRVRALADGEQVGPVQFFNIGSPNHAAEHLVFYLPQQKILFQSDMGRASDDGEAEPARQTVLHPAGTHRPARPGRRDHRRRPRRGGHAPEPSAGRRHAGFRLRRRNNLTSNDRGRHGGSGCQSPKRWCTA